MGGTVVSAPHVLDIKIFVPARDFAVSTAYYLALGGKMNWQVDELAEFELGSTRFLLQDYYVQTWAENFVMHLRVDDAAAWHQHIVGMIEGDQFPGIRVRPPKVEPWGDTITYAWDPSGVLLHFAQTT
jgi:hypothetical protein